MSEIELEEYIDLEEYQDFAEIFVRRMMGYVSDRNMEAIHEALEYYATDDGSLSNADLAFLGCWLGYLNSDEESFWWIGYVLSIKTGFEELVAKMFIAKNQKDTDDFVVTIGLKDGSTVQVAMKDIEEFVANNADSIQLQESQITEGGEELF